MDGSMGLEIRSESLTDTLSLVACWDTHSIWGVVSKFVLSLIKGESCSLPIVIEVGLDV